MSTTSFIIKSGEIDILLNDNIIYSGDNIVDASIYFSVALLESECASFECTTKNPDDYEWFLTGIKNTYNKYRDHIYDNITSLAFTDYKMYLHLKSLAPQFPNVNTIEFYRCPSVYEILGNIKKHYPKLDQVILNFQTADYHSPLENLVYKLDINSITICYLNVSDNFRYLYEPKLDLAEYNIRYVDNMTIITKI